MLTAIELHLHFSHYFYLPHYHVKDIKNLLISWRTSWFGDRLLALVCNSFGNILVLLAHSRMSAVVGFMSISSAIKTDWFHFGSLITIIIISIITFPSTPTTSSAISDKQVVSGEVALRFNIVGVKSNQLTICIF